MRRQINEPAARADMKWRRMLADRLDRIGDLLLGALLQFLEKIVEHGGGIEAGRAEPVEQHIAFLQGQQPAFPRVGDRAFLRQQRPRAELEGDRAQFRVADPIAPFTQIPYATRHEDWRRIEAELAHQAAQFAYPREGRLGPQRVFAVGDPVMPAGEPRVFVDNAAEPVAEFVIGALPQGAKGARRGDDRVVVDAVAGADLGDLIRHAGTAGDAVDHAARAFQNPVQDTLGGRHFPQHIHVDAALAIRALIGDAGLLDAAGNRVGDELLMSLAPGAAVIDLRDQLAVLVVAVGVDAGEGADPARGGPGPRTLAIRDRDALAAFDERQGLAPGNDERVERLHQFAPCRIPREEFAPAALCRSGGCTRLTGRIISGTSEKTEVIPHSKSVRARCGSLTV